MSRMSASYELFNALLQVVMQYFMLRTESFTLQKSVLIIQRARLSLLVVVMHLRSSPALHAAQKLRGGIYLATFKMNVFR